MKIVQPPLSGADRLSRIPLRRCASQSLTGAQKLLTATRSATIAAATHPDLVSAIVEIDPATRPLRIGLGGPLTNSRHRRATVLLAEWIVTGSVKRWSQYLDIAYPGTRPGDWERWLAALAANQAEPGRVRAAQSMARSKQVDAGHYPHAQYPQRVADAIASFLDEHAYA